VDFNNTIVKSPTGYSDNSPNVSKEKESQDVILNLIQPEEAVNLDVPIGKENKNPVEESPKPKVRGRKLFFSPNV